MSGTTNRGTFFAPINTKTQQYPPLRGISINSSSSSSSSSSIRAQDISGVLGFEDYLSPNNSSGESLIHCAIVRTCLYSRSVSALRRISINSSGSIRTQDVPSVLAVKVISHPIIRLGSHSFIAPFYVLACIRAQEISSVNIVRSILQR